MSVLDEADTLLGLEGKSRVNVPVTPQNIIRGHVTITSWQRFGVGRNSAQPQLMRSPFATLLPLTCCRLRVQ